VNNEKQIGYEDMSPELALPSAVAEALTEYGYRERVLGISKAMGVDDADPAGFMRKDLEARDRAAAKCSEIVSATIGLDGEVESTLRGTRVSLPDYVDRAISSALRSYSRGKGKTGSRSALREAIRDAITEAEQQARAESESLISGLEKKIEGMLGPGDKATEEEGETAK